MKIDEIKKKYLGDKSLEQLRRSENPGDVKKYSMYSTMKAINKSTDRQFARGAFNSPDAPNPKNYKTLVSACEEAISTLDRWVSSVPSSAGFEGGLSKAKTAINALKALAQQKMRNAK